MWVTIIYWVYTALLEKLKKAVVEGVGKVARYMIYQTFQMLERILRSI